LDGNYAVGCGSAKDYSNIHIFQHMFQRSNAITPLYVVCYSTYLTAHTILPINQSVAVLIPDCWILDLLF